MGLASKLHATCALAYYSLFPPTAAAAPSAAVTSANNTPPYIINPSEIAATIASLDRFCDSDGAIALIFRDALMLAAPFLLFRLKRTAYSLCRVTATDHGLLLTARR